MKKTRQNFQYTRNPIYIVYALLSLLLFIPFAVSASKGTVSGLEQDIFDLIYGLNAVFENFFLFITQFGSFLVIPLAALIFLIMRRPDRALRVAMAGSLAYVLARLCKELVERGRPDQMLGFVARDSAAGFGFPSGHAAVATAVGLVVAMYVTRKWQKVIFLIIAFVCVSRIYLGVHFPYDVIGGYLIGIFSYSVINVILGAPYFPINPKELAKKLQQRGLKGLVLKPAAVDARGSVPFFGEYSGEAIFVKVYNRENNLADWLFKLSRRIIYRRLEDETPALSPKRGIEHEAYLTLLAQTRAGVRGSELIGTYHVGPKSYAMITKLIDAKGLDKIDRSLVTDQILEDTWREIRKLHDSGIVHRDLRCANVMIHNKTKEPWLIDFGFAESSSDENQFYRDTVEFIASSATLVGPERAVSSAKKILGPQRLKEAIVYMQYAALSGATTTTLKKNKNLLKEIRQAMYAATGTTDMDIKDVKLTRVSKSNLFQLGLLILLIIVLIPQIDSFKSSFKILLTADIALFILACVVSAITYLWSAFSYKILSAIPLALGKLYVVQWASSFANRLVPAGLGSLSLNTLFLIRSGHEEGGAATVAVVNNILGFVSSIIMLLLAFLTHRELFTNSGINLSGKAALLWVVFLVVLIGIVIVVARTSKKLRDRFRRWWGESKRSLNAYSKTPGILFQALLSQLLVTTTYSMVLFVSALALGVHFSFAEAIFIVSAGVALGSITPTPGGIGGAEAGLTVAMTWLGAPLDTSIAIALLYRLATFWFTILPGYVAFRYASAKRYFT